MVGLPEVNYKSFTFPARRGKSAEFSVGETCLVPVKLGETSRQQAYLVSIVWGSRDTRGNSKIPLTEAPQAGASANSATSANLGDPAITSSGRPVQVWPEPRSSSGDAAAPCLQRSNHYSSSQ
jgi:hypothetical protein